MAINNCHIRSLSLPSRSHPTTVEIQEQLNKLSSSSAAPTAEAISNGLCGLVELYKSMDDLLNLPQTLQVFSTHQNAKWVEEILECPVKFLDVCGVTRDLVSLLKENVRDVQSSLRRRKGDMSIEAAITKYTSFTKKMKKDAKRSIATLKKMDQAIEASSILDVDQQVSSLIRVLREVNAMTISIFQAVLIFLSSASKSKQSKWSFSRLLVNKQRVACEGQAIANELEIVDDALTKDCSSAQQKLQSLESSIEGIENGLEGMNRCLIKSRTILLNVVSC